MANDGRNKDRSEVAEVEEELSKVLPAVMRTIDAYARVHAYWFDRDDVVGETMVRLLTHFEGQARVRPRIVVMTAFTIARRYIIDQARKRKPVTVLPMEDLIAIAPIDQYFTDNWAELSDTLAAVRALPDHLREIIVLVCIADRSLSEAADIIGVSPSTARRLHNRAIERLRRAIKSGAVQHARPTTSTEEESHGWQ